MRCAVKQSLQGVVLLVGHRGVVRVVALDRVDRFDLFPVLLAALEIQLLHPAEVPALDDGGGELFPRVGSARDPVLDVAVLALPAVAIVEGAAGVLLAAQDAVARSPFRRRRSSLACRACRPVGLPE